MAEIEPIPGGGTGPDDHTSVPTAPVAAPAAAPDAGGPRPGAPGERPKGLVRWGVALLVLAATVGVVSVAAAMLAAGNGASAVQGWLPTGTVAYLEVRADMPGDQRAKVGDIIAKFPGFADQASLDAKVDEALQRLLDGAGIDWAADVKPWLGGEVGFAATDAVFDVAKAVESQGTPDPATAAAAADGVVVLVSVKDAAAATAWVSAQIEGDKKTETYAGGEITLVEGPLGADMAYAVRGSVLIMGPATTVKAALDTKGSSPVASSASFAAARKTAPSAYLAFGFLDTKAFMDAALDLAGDSAMAGGDCLEGAIAAVPAWMAGSVRAADDALVMESTWPSVEQATDTVTASESAIASRLPATTIAAIEMRDFGPTVLAGLEAMKKQLACDESTAQVIEQVEQALAAVGGPEALVGWADDTALAIEFADGTLGGGLAAVASDEAAAERTVQQLQALLALGGSSMGVSVREETYGDGTLLLIEVASAELFAEKMPALAVTAQDGVFVLGTLDFVKRVLDTDAAASLATQPAYERAISAAGGDGISDVFVDIGGIRAAVESMLPADEKAEYETDIKPFLEPFEAFAAVGEAPGATTTSRAVITFVK